MREPITPTEIREGDIVRAEEEDGRAWEWRASQDGDLDGLDPSTAFFLVERPVRPETPVPTTPTLGWITIDDPEAVAAGPGELGVWSQYDYRFGLDGVGRSVIQWEREIQAAHVAGFTPAIAIPADVADALAKSLASLHEASAVNLDLWPEAAAFVTAVERDS